MILTEREFIKNRLINQSSGWSMCGSQWDNVMPLEMKPLSADMSILCLSTELHLYLFRIGCLVYNLCAADTNKRQDISHFLSAYYNPYNWPSKTWSATVSWRECCSWAAKFSWLGVWLVCEIGMEGRHPETTGEASFRTLTIRRVCALRSLKMNPVFRGPPCTVFLDCNIWTTLFPRYLDERDILLIP